MKTYTLTVFPNLPKGMHRRYPFNQMEVGDTVLVEKKDRSKIASASCNYGKRNDKHFIVRLYTHEGIVYAACQRME